MSPVPEVPVAEDRDLSATQDDIRPPGEICCMNFETQAEPPECLAEH